MRRTSIVLLTLLLGCGKATLVDGDAGDGDGDGDDGGSDCGGGCTADQVCLNDTCEDLDEVAVPAYASLWPDVTGWVQVTDQPIQATFDTVDIPGIVYECRTGHDSIFAALPFGNCDDTADGTTPLHTPSPTAAQEEGGYRTELRLRLGEWTSAVIGYDFYVHHSLDNVPGCAAPGADAAIFAAAAARPNFVQEQFPGTTEVQAPFIHLPFRNVIRHQNMNDGYPGSFNTGDPFDVDLVSLRRRFALNDDGTLLLIQRRYISRMRLANNSESTCRNSFRFGVNHSVTTSPRRQFVDCVNFVLNSRGEGVCVDLAQVPAITLYTDIGWAKLIPRREAFSLKGIPSACVSTADRLCWPWYLETPE